MKDARCPCCDQIVAAYPIETMQAVVSPVMAEIIHALSRRAGEFVSCNDICDFVYRRDPNGGPEYPSSAVGRVIQYNRSKVAAMGWAITGRHGPGGGYALTTPHGNTT